jgi:hypothetical protein
MPQKIEKRENKNMKIAMVIRNGIICGLFANRQNMKATLMTPPHNLIDAQPSHF